MAVSAREQCSKCRRTYSRPGGTKNICERCRDKMNGLETCKYCGGNKIMRVDWHEISKCPQCKGKGVVPVGAVNDSKTGWVIG